MEVLQTYLTLKAFYVNQVNHVTFPVIDCNDTV